MQIMTKCNKANDYSVHFTIKMLHPSAVSEQWNEVDHFEFGQECTFVRTLQILLQFLVFLRTMPLLSCKNSCSLFEQFQGKNSWFETQRQRKANKHFQRKGSFINFESALLFLLLLFGSPMPFWLKCKTNADVKSYALNMYEKCVEPKQKWKFLHFYSIKLG